MTEANTAELDVLQEEVAPTFMKPEDVLSETSVWPLTAHIFGACFCMGCSAIFHLFGELNKETATILARLDYSGISILIFGSTIPIANYGFACENTIAAKWGFLFVMGIGCLACFIVTLAPKFD